MNSVVNSNIFIKIIEKYLFDDFLLYCNFEMIEKMSNCNKQLRLLYYKILLISSLNRQEHNFRCIICGDKFEYDDNIAYCILCDPSCICINCTFKIKKENKHQIIKQLSEQFSLPVVITGDIPVCLGCITDSNIIKTDNITITIELHKKYLTYQKGIALLH